MSDTRELTDIDREEIARLIKDGFTSGILDDEDGYRISWKLGVDVFKH